MDDKVRLDRDGPVAIVTIDNPPVNALGRAVFRGLDAVVSELESDTSVRAVVVAGAGERAFVAGAELSEFSDLLASREALEEHIEWPRGIFSRLGGLECPVIAAVHADAMGGGWELALVCDLIVADEGARLGMSEVRLGTLPGGGGTQRLPRRVSPNVALELLMLGTPISAARAYEIGAVNRVARSGTAMEEALALAQKLAALPKVAVSSIKRCVDEGLQQRLTQGLVLERELFLRTFESEDLVEGYQAFLEKRKPEFVHR